LFAVPETTLCTSPKMVTSTLLSIILLSYAAAHGASASDVVMDSDKSLLPSEEHDADDCVAKGVCEEQHVSLLQRTHMVKMGVHDAEETKTIHVVFNSSADANRSAELIMDAMKEAGLTLEEWKPQRVRTPDHNANFPVTMDVVFERVPSASVAAATTPAPVQALLQEEDEQDEDLSSNQTLVDLILDGKSGKKPTQKQLNWAARAISKLESKICSRHRSGKAVAYARSSYMPWWSSCASGYEWDGVLLCYKKCVSGYYPVSFLCHQDCGKKEDTWSECIERCRDVPGSPSPLDTTCSLFYCGQSTGDCASHGANIALSFASMFANFIPGGKALTGIKKAVKKGTMAAMKAAMKKAVKDVAKKMLKKAKKNLKKVMKSQKEDLKDELKDAILQGGAEQVAEVFIAKTQTGYLKDTAVEILKEVDPTGIADVVGSFEADRCRDKVIEEFPDEDEPSRRRRRRTSHRRRRRALLEKDEVDAQEGEENADEREGLEDDADEGEENADEGEDLEDDAEEGEENADEGEDFDVFSS